MGAHELLLVSGLLLRAEHTFKIISIVGLTSILNIIDVRKMGPYAKLRSHLYISSAIQKLISIMYSTVHKFQQCILPHFVW